MSAPAAHNPFEPPKAALVAEAADEVAPALWNPDAAGAWSLLLSPIFGSFLVRSNWRAIGDDEKARSGTVWIAVSVIMLAITSLAGSLFALIYIIVWYFAWQRPQSRYIKDRWGGGYPRKGWGKPIGIALLVYVATVAILFAVFMAIGTVSRH